MRRSISKFHTIVALAILAFAIHAGNAFANLTITLGGPLPPPPPPPYTSLTSVTKVVAGSANTLALKSDGTVWAWGYNVNGELGDGTSATKLSPVQVPSLTNVTTIAAGYFHFLAVKSDGTVWTWGWNQHGQLGDGSTINRTAPVQVAGLTGVVAIAAGWGHSFAVKSDGTLWAWGNNDFGQLGDGTTIERHTPVQVSGLTGVVAVADTVALKSNGTVWAWGANDVGQVGDGTDVERHTPVQVIGLTGITAIASGGAHYVAIKNDGTLWGWGWNIYGQLGDGTTTNRHTAVQINGVSGVTHIAAGALHTVVRKSDGSVSAWGYNEDGELGNGNILGSQTPLQVSVAYAYSVAAGGFHSLAVTADGIVRSWGWNVHGQLGDGTTASRTRPVLAGGLNGNNIAGGLHFALSVKTDHTVWGWGTNDGGVLGQKMPPAPWVEYTPIQINGLSQIMSLSAGIFHSLALKKDGSVWAWGNNNQGQLGDGTTQAREVPGLVNGLANVMSIAVGRHHSLALKSDGTVWAWGGNFSGQLGDGTFVDRLTPVQVYGLSEIIAIGAGFDHSIALKADGTVWAWGANEHGQLGWKEWDITVTEPQPYPVPVKGLSGVISIAAGHLHNLALKYDGTVWAWGANFKGQVGDGSAMNNKYVPVAVKTRSSITAIAAGKFDDLAHSVALASDGTVWAWGGNEFGGLGINSLTDQAEPVQVLGLYNVAAIAAGDGHTLAVKNDGSVWAWGNIVIKKEDGTNGFSIVPALVNCGCLDGYDFNLTPHYVIGLDTTPEPFSFISQNGVPLHSEIRSNTITVSGINTATPISITNGRYAIDGQVSTSGTVFNGQTIWIDLPSANAFSTTTTTTLTIGGVSATFSVTTLAADTTPDAFSFIPCTNATLNTLVTSNAISVTGINTAAPISIVGGEYSINGGNWTSTPGTVGNYKQSVRVRVLSSASHNATATAILNIGGVSAAYKVATKSQDANNFNTKWWNSGSMAAGSVHALAVKADGTVWAWGDNSYGQLGDSTNTNRSTPVQIATIYDAVAVSAGDYHSLAVKSDGTVWAWGNNAQGQLGDGTQTNRLAPVQVIGLNGIKAIAAGQDFSIALKNDGTVWAWGKNSSGQLGDSVVATSATPVQVVGLNDVIAVAAGLGHSLALKSDGTVWTWGAHYTQIPNGIALVRSALEQVVGLGGMVSIATHGLKMFALKQDGTVWVWGYSGYQTDALGTGLWTWWVQEPVQIVKMTNAMALDVGVAVKSDGTTWSWIPQVDNSLLFEFSPHYIPAPITNLTGVVTAASYGNGGYALALKADGTVWRWVTSYSYLNESDGISKEPVQVKLQNGAEFKLLGDAPDIAPSAFSFAPQIGVALGAVATSSVVTVSGINTPSPISVVGGEYSINGGAWTSAASTVYLNQTVTVRLTSSSSFNTTTSATLTIGGVSGTFSVTTAARDITPDQFSFTPMTGAPINTLVESNAVVISGINDAAPMTVTGQGEYSVNGGAWTGNPGTVVNGDSVKVRIMSSGSPLTTVDTKLVINGVQGTFSVSTAVIDTIPDAFSFTSVANVPLSTVTTSNAIAISGINAPSPVNITGGEYSINGGAWSSAGGSITNGQTVAVRTTSLAQFGSTWVTVTIGGVSAKFYVTTAPQAGTPSLNTPWWRADGAYKSWAVVQNTSNSPVQVISTITSYSGVSYTDPVPVVLGAGQVAYIGMSDYVGSIGGKTSGALQLHYTGNASDIIADMFSLGPEGYSYLATMRGKSGTSTTLNTPWWRADGSYKSWVIVQNLSDAPVEVSTTVISYSGQSYTDPVPVSIGPRQVTYVYLNSYVGNLGGKTSGALKVSHNGAPGDVIAQMLSLGPEGYCYSKPLRDNSGTGTILSAPWWRADGAYKSWAVVQNISNSPVEVTPRVISYSGVSYTDAPITIGAQQVTYIYLNNYVGNIGGKTSGALELSHNGLAGDVIAEMLSLGPEGYAYTTGIREGNPAAGTTLHAPWWRADGSYKSWVIVQNTSDAPVQVTPKVISYSGVSYTDAPITIGARQVTYVYLNSYAGNIGGRTSGAVEINYTGNAGDVIAEMLSLGPQGYSYSTPMR